MLYGRGACDMKGAIAAFVAAAARICGGEPRRVDQSLLITGDEEGEAIDGTVRVLEWMAANRQVPDFCLVGEPTCVVRLGDMVKIGRRGSLNARITVHGVQGHVAYPHRADNPVHRLVRALAGADRGAAGCGQRRGSSRRACRPPASMSAIRRRMSFRPAPRAALNIRFNDRIAARR